ncbi:hypothetical protein JKG47_07055 [Acidithiobacillus sp. MC6.1]|nr:hypothetical protein [Acidithiobacillus sp. MC6.1]
MLPVSIHNGAFRLSALPGVAEPAIIAFACSALFLILIDGYCLMPGLGLNWTGPIAAYLLFPFVAFALTRWTTLHGWSVPVIALTPVLAFDIFCTLVDMALDIIERGYPAPTTENVLDTRLYRGLGRDAPGREGMGLVPVRDMSWRAVLTSRDPVLLRRAAQDARDCGAPDIADILDHRAAPCDNARREPE